VSLNPLLAGELLGAVCAKTGGRGMIRFGLVGVNTMHAGVFAGIFNGRDGAPPALEGGRATSVWGQPDGDVRALAQTYGVEQVVSDPITMIGGIDAVLIVDDTGGGGSHARLARPFIEAGLPTFIDKPMTLEFAEAVELFDLAERSGAPLLSASALRYAVELEGLHERLATLGPVSSVVSVGPGDWYYYGVHAVELYQTVLGPPADDVAVHRHAFAERDVAVVGSGAGPTVVVETLRDASYVFHLTVYCAEGWVDCEVRDPDAFYIGLMAAMMETVSTGRSPVSREQTLGVLGVLDAGRRSAELGRAVRLEEVLGV